MWKSGQKIQYMVLTGHFVDLDWKLQKKVLNFVDVSPHHSGVAVCDALYWCLQEWGIESKVSTIIVDNASYNDLAVKMLQDRLSFHKRLPLKDCCTWWNATYAMLSCALEFKQVFPRYAQGDQHYKHLPSEEDWYKAEEVCNLLGLFNKVTNIISANLFLLELWSIKELLDEKSRSEVLWMKCMAKKM